VIFLSDQRDPILYGGNRLIEADQLTGIGERNRPHTVMVFGGPDATELGTGPLSHGLNNNV
jgi:hypothetical protein